MTFTREYEDGVDVSNNGIVSFHKPGYLIIDASLEQNEPKTFVIKSTLGATGKFNLKDIMNIEKK